MEDGWETEDARIVPYRAVTSDSPSIPGFVTVYASPGTPGAAVPPGPRISGYPYMFTFAMLVAPAGSTAAIANAATHVNNNVYLSIQHPFNITIS
jgi:hypothetical protein